MEWQGWATLVGTLAVVYVVGKTGQSIAGDAGIFPALAVLAGVIVVAYVKWARRS